MIKRKKISRFNLRTVIFSLIFKFLPIFLIDSEYFYYMTEEKISFDEFKKLDIRIGLILEAEVVPKSRSLVKLKVDIGESEPRQIVAGISQYYKPEELINKKIVVLANLQPRKLMGLESNGMLLAADVDHTPYLLKLPDGSEKDIPPGTKIS